MILTKKMALFTYKPHKIPVPTLVFATGYQFLPVDTEVNINEENSLSIDETTL